MYTIKKCENKKLTINDEAWSGAEVAKIDTVNWPDVPDIIAIPNTTAKLLYNDYGIFVQLTTDENPLLATHRVQNSPVCNDSCMEFFVRPNANDERYFNFEFNPFGTMYLGFRKDRYDFKNVEENRDYFDVTSYVGEKLWTLQFVIPFEFIDKYLGSHTDTMHGNIYKCGNIKHYATYYPIETEKPDYHRPEFFGEFVLEK